MQLFDSWAGALGPRDFREFALPVPGGGGADRPEGRRAGDRLRARAPDGRWRRSPTATGADVIGVDWQTDAAEARRRLATTPVALQGNLDPMLALRPSVRDRARTHAMLEAFGGVGHIANLGHGILPDVPVEHARPSCDAVQAWRPR